MANNTIFDDVFRTMLERMPQLIVPVINEVFGTDYPEDIPIVQRRNEHFTSSGEIITDSHLFIANKVYHIECQSTSDAAMIIRMVEYDFAVALEFAEKENGRYRIYFPQSCVIYLRGKKGPGYLEMDLVMPDGRKIGYKVPIVRVENYTCDVIFQKKLLFLLPFYIIRYEKSAELIERDDDTFHALMAEYVAIQKRLEQNFLKDGKEKEYRDLLELITRIADYIFADADRAKKGIGEVMGGKVLELESDKLIAKGKEQGLELGKQETAVKMLLAGKYAIEEIADISGLAMEKVLEIKSDRGL